MQWNRGAIGDGISHLPYDHQRINTTCKFCKSPWQCMYSGRYLAHYHTTHPTRLLLNHGGFTSLACCFLSDNIHGARRAEA